MTKKHYEAIAKILKDTSEQCNPHFQTDRNIRNLSDYFATDNRNFDRARFLAACGIIE